MADHSSSKSNQQSGEHKGGPTVAEKAKADALPAGNLDEETETRLENEAEDAGTRHPNRHYNKPDNGKGSYS